MIMALGSGNIYMYMGVHTINLRISMRWVCVGDGVISFSYMYYIQGRFDTGASNLGHSDMILKQH